MKARVVVAGAVVALCALAGPVRAEVRRVWGPAPEVSFALDDAAPLPVITPLAPAPAATGQRGTVTLTVQVNDPDGGPLEVTFLGRPRPPEGEFVVAVLPDTQFYAESYPDIFVAQTSWLAANAGLPIVFVSHVGDVVDVATDPLQWSNADAALGLLDGVIPYGLAPGNHDTPTTEFNQTFPTTRYEAEPWYGGHHGDTNDSSYQLVSAADVDLLFLHLAWCPGADVLAWGAEVLAQHPERLAIVTTHGYLNAQGNRSVGLCSSTLPIWTDLVEPSPNVRLVLCGHMAGTGYRRDVVGERVVHQVLADYQAEANGGNGWLRLYHFAPADEVVHVETYSPWLQQNRTDPANAFSLDVPLGPPWARVARRTGVAHGQVLSVAWAGLEGGTAYQWRVEATGPNGGRAVSPRGGFTTLPALRASQLALTLVSFGGGYRQATARVTVEPALANARVRGDWRLDGELVKADVQATTGPTGLALLPAPPRKAAPGQIFTFRLTGLARTGYLYAPSKNLASEGSVAVP